MYHVMVVAELSQLFVFFLSGCYWALSPQKYLNYQDSKIKPLYMSELRHKAQHRNMILKHDTHRNIDTQTGAVATRNKNVSLGIF